MEIRRGEMQQEHGELSGRKGLFAVNNPEAGKPDDKFTREQISEIVELISSFTGKETPDLPDIFIPLLRRIQSESGLLDQRNEECHKLKSELSEIQSDWNVMKSEHETYLADLISSHTEFDRALEIFQYHTIPMVLLGADKQVQDANDAFCTLFSVERSEITKQYPPFSRYVPDTIPFTAPDNNSYYLVSIKPPIVPFDHEAVSLELLLPELSKEEAEECDILSHEMFTNVFEKIPFALAIIDEYYTIQYENSALHTLLGRSRPQVHLRDIASCGVSPEITDSIINTFVRDEDADITTTVTRLDGSSQQVWIQQIPLTIGDERYLILIFLPDEDNDVQEEVLSEKRAESSDTIPSTSITADSDNQLLQTLLEVNPSPIAILNSKSEILFVNEGFSELIGVTSEELIGSTPKELGVSIPPIDYDNPDITVLSEEICIESPYGEQCYSGLIITDSSGISPRSLLMLQPGEELASKTTLDVSKPPDRVLEKKEVLPEPEKERETEPEIEIRHQYGIDPLKSPMPVAKYSGTEIVSVNNPFYTWTGISDQEGLYDHLQALSSHIMQSVKDTSQVYSTLFPNGLKSYRVQVLPDSEISNSGTGWFVDLTDTYDKISVLERETERLKEEIERLRATSSSETLLKTEDDELINQIDIVEFELSGGRYAMDIGMVREVVEMLPITPLPRTPPHIIGIINLRGEVTHVIDLGVLLGEGLRKDRAGQKIIIVPPDAAQGEHLGIIVDNVRSVTEIGVKQVTSLGEEINTRIQTNIKGIIKVTHDDIIEKRNGEEKEANLVIWLDMKEILASLAGFR